MGRKKKKNNKNIAVKSSQTEIKYEKKQDVSTDSEKKEESAAPSDRREISEEQEIVILKNRLHKDSQIKVEELILIILLVLVCSAMFYWQNQLTKQLEEAKRVISTMDEQIASYKENEANYIAASAEQQEKIQLLSDTLNSKSEQLTAYQDAETALHVPNGYPVKGSATVLSGGLLDEEEMEGENIQEFLEGYHDFQEGDGEYEPEPNILFMVSEGTCITATGTGKVADIQISDNGLKYLKINHENGYESIYKCIGNVLVNVGDSVSSGSVLMSVTENASYFEYQIRYEDSFINPKDCMIING